MALRRSRAVPDSAPAGSGVVVVSSTEQAIPDDQQTKLDGGKAERRLAVVVQSDAESSAVAERQGNPTVSVVIPAKNEARNLPHVLSALPDVLHEVILVDGNSTDGTADVALECRPDIIVIGQNRKGKGNALACGFARATGDFIVMLDADGSTDPAEIPRFVDALRQGADFAKGSRFMPGAGSTDISRLRQAGNYWLNRIVNLLYGTRYTDLCYGYNAFRRGCLDVMGLDTGSEGEAYSATMLWGDGFEVETLINVRIAKARVRVFEVPSFERNRVFGTSNLNAFSDGLRVLRTIHIERSRGTRRAAAEDSIRPRRPGTTWSRLSTMDEGPA